MALLVLWAMPWGWAQAERIAVAAASDLTHVLEELGQHFHAPNWS